MTLPGGSKVETRWIRPENTVIHFSTTSLQATLIQKNHYCQVRHEAEKIEKCNTNVRSTLVMDGMDSHTLVRCRQQFPLTRIQKGQNRHFSDDGVQPAVICGYILSERFRFIFASPHPTLERVTTH